MSRALAELPVRVRGAVFVLVAILSVLAYFGITGEHGRVRSLPTGRITDARAALDRAELAFAGDGNEFLFLVEARGDHDLVSGPGAAVWRALEREVEALEGVDALLTPDDVPLADGADPRAHPLIGGRLLSDDGRVALLPVLAASYGDWAAPREMVEVARRVEGDAARVTVTGQWAVFSEMGEALERDRKHFLVLSFALSFVLGWIVFRGVASVLVAGGAPMLGVLWTYGALGWLGEHLNALTAAVLPILVAMIGFTDAVHIVMHVRARRAAGDAPREAALSAVRALAGPCAMTSFTTAVGFGSLVVSSGDVVRDFGFASLIGVLCTFVAVVAVVPAVASTPLGRPLVARGKRRRARVLERGLPLLDLATRRAGTVTVLGAAATALMIVCPALVLRPDDRIAHDLPSSSPAARALTVVDEAFGGFQVLQVSAEWKEDVPPPAVLEVLAEAEHLLADAPDVARPLSIRAVLATLPGGAERPEAALPALALAPERLTRGLWAPERRAARVVARVRDHGIDHYRPVYAELGERVARLADEHPGVELSLTGSSLVYGAHVDRIVLDLVGSLGVAALILFAALAVAFRSLRTGLISIVPNLFPLAVTATVLALAGEELEIASVCAFVICLGIAVDDTIHFLARYRTELLACGEPREAARRAYLGVGRALLATTAILLAGFGVVLTSELPGNRVFAAMACTTIAAALVGDLLILPAMLVRFRPRRSGSS